MPKKSGKDRGSLTQKADSQQVRISQVSNVSKAVSNMGKKTTQQMQETERRVNEGSDVKAMAGSMTSVLDSLKVTVDTLNKGVETATLGTARAAKDAISQYGKAITEDYSINRKNMVASALGSASPIFGHFAAKFLETNIFKSTTEKMKQGIANIFEKKSKGGSMPDDFGDYGKKAAKNREQANAQRPLQSKSQDQKKAKQKKQDTIDAFKIVNREKAEKYDKPSEEKMLTAVISVQKALGGQLGKFDQWYSKLLIEHPYFRMATTAARATSAVMGGTWKAVYFFWKKRGGYAKYMSKSKQPLEAINQNIAQTFVQMMPRLDAIMVYNKATAEAIRDLSTHVTGKKYGRVDPNRIQGTWTLAGGTMKVIRFLRKGARKLADRAVDKFTTAGSRTNRILKGGIGAVDWTGRAADMILTGPGRMKEWVKGKTVGKFAGNVERRRAFGGLGATGFDMPGQRRVGQPITDPRFLLPAPKKESKMKKWLSKIRMPKSFKGMGKKLKPTAIVQGVYDEYMARQEKKKEKERKKMYGMTSDIAKGVKKQNKRQRRKTIFSIIGSVFSAIGSIVTFAWGFISPFIGLFKKGISSFIGSMIGGGVVRAALGKLAMAAVAALTNPVVIAAIIALISGLTIGTWINKILIKPLTDWWERGRREKTEATSKELSEKSRKNINLLRNEKASLKDRFEASSHETLRGDIGAAHGRAKYKQKQRLETGFGFDIEFGGEDAVNDIQMSQRKYIDKNSKEYLKYSPEERRRVRAEWVTKFNGGFRDRNLFEDPIKYGEKREKAFLKYLKKKGTKESKESRQQRIGKFKESAKRADAAKAAAANKKGSKASVGMKTAIQFISKYGGQAKDYIGKKYSEAEAHGKKLLETSKEAWKNRDNVKMEDATLLVQTYGGQAKDYVGKNYDKAINYGRKLLEDNKGVVKKGKVGIEEATQYVKTYGGQAKDYVDKTYSQALSHGKNMIEKAPEFKAKGKVGIEEATQLVQKYGGKIRDYVGLPMSQVPGAAKSVLRKVGEFFLGRGANIGDAAKLVRKYGGEIKDYVGKRYVDANIYGMKLASKKSRKKVLDKTKVGKTFATKLVRKYGGDIKDYLGKSYAAAINLAKKRVFSKSKITQKQEEVKIHEVTQLIRRYGGEFKDYYGKSFNQAEAYGKSLVFKSGKSKTKDIVGTARASKLVMQYGGVRGDYIGKPFAQAVAYGKSLVEKGKSFMSLFTGTVGLNSATKLSLKFGGEIREYIGKKYDQAVAYGKSLVAKGKDLFKPKVEVGMLEASKLVQKYGGGVTDYIGKSYSEAERVGKQSIFKSKKKPEELVGVVAADRLIQRYGGYRRDYIGKTFTQAEAYGRSLLKRKPIVSAIRIEEGLMKFKRDKGKTRLQELWSKASPEQKEYIRQHAQEILAGGDQAAKALDKLEKGMKDASDKNAKQVGSAVVSSAAYTTNNISNAVNNISSGGGSSKSNLLNEKTMDDIMRGDLSF